MPYGFSSYELIDDEPQDPQRVKGVAKIKKVVDPLTRAETFLAIMVAGQVTGYAVELGLRTPSLIESHDKIKDLEAKTAAQPDGTIGIAKPQAHYHFQGADVVAANKIEYVPTKTVLQDEQAHFNTLLIGTVGSSGPFGYVSPIIGGLFMYYAFNKVFSAYTPKIDDKIKQRSEKTYDRFQNAKQFVDKTANKVKTFARQTFGKNNDQPKL